MNKKIVYFIEGRIALGLCLLFAFAVSPSFVSGQCTVSSLGIQPTRLTNKAETANKGNIPRFRSDLMPINPNLKSTASNGWSISVGDWRWYFAQTKHIHLKKGYHIEALLFYSNGNGNGYLFAWPNRVPRPQLSSKIDNAELIRKQTGDLTPVSIFENEKGKSSYFHPGFSKYARDVVSVLESDGTLDAYLELVVLIGEISDYGDEWHGCSGISFLNENEVWELVSKDELRDITDETLKKYEEKGEEYYLANRKEFDQRYGFRVTEEGDKIIVRRCAFTIMNDLGLRLYEYVFQRGSLNYKLKITQIAKGRSIAFF